MKPIHRAAVRAVLVFAALSIGAALAQPANAVFTANIVQMNPQLTGSSISGQAIITVAGDDVVVTLVAKGLPAGMRLAHIHGFTEAKSSTCPSANADVNGDGIVDLIETEPAAGVTLIPFNADPAGAMILSDSYPVASQDGLLIYHATVGLSALSAAMAKDHDISDLNLGDRVIFIHGVAEGQSLPSTVESLPGVPAEVTVPIACGELNPL